VFSRCDASLYDLRLEICKRSNKEISTFHANGWDTQAYYCQLRASDKGSATFVTFGFYNRNQVKLR